MKTNFMKIWVAGLSGMLCASLAQASLDPSAKIVAAASLSYRTNLGTRARVNLIVKSNDKKKFIIVNGAVLDDTQSLRSSPYLTRALQMDHHERKSAAASCAAGEFEHLVYLQGKKMIEHGCLTDPAFSELEQSFKILQTP